jgi:hypothetical protein
MRLPFKALRDGVHGSGLVEPARLSLHMIKVQMK